MTTGKTTKAVAEDGPKAAKVTGATSGVMAPGAAGKAARKANQEQFAHFSGQLPAWDQPGAKYRDDDQSIDARMWRLKQDHIAMGSRTE